MPQISSEIVIDAPADRIWRILTDFPAFPLWNPFITNISGSVATGERLKVFIRPPGEKELGLTPRVLKSEPGRELRWLGNLFIRGIFDGEHAFIIEPIGPNKSRFIQSERFSGVLVPFFGGMLEKTRLGFDKMNQALKERAEANSRTP